MYIHRSFTHPGGVSPMKQEKVEEEEAKEKKKKGFDFSKKKDYSGTTATSKAITDFVTPQNNLELGLEFLGGGAGVGIGKGVSKLAKTKAGKKLINKLPWLSKLTEPLAKTPKNKGFDFTGGKGKTNPKEFNFTGNKPKGGVDGGLSDDAAEVYYKDLEMRTVPVRGGKQFADPMGEYNSIKSMHNELPNNVVKPGNPVFNEAGELTGYNMDKVKGVDLDTWMKDGNKLSKEMYDDMVTKITDLNKKGIYHGDLKINNIMIDESGTWKLIDPVGFKHASNMGEDMLKVAQEYDAKALIDLGKYVK